MARSWEANKLSEACEQGAMAYFHTKECGKHANGNGMLSSNPETNSSHRLAWSLVARSIAMDAPRVHHVGALPPQHRPVTSGALEIPARLLNDDAAPGRRTDMLDSAANGPSTRCRVRSNVPTAVSPSAGSQGLRSALCAEDGTRPDRPGMTPPAPTLDSPIGDRSQALTSDQTLERVGLTEASELLRRKAGGLR